MKPFNGSLDVEAAVDALRGHCGLRKTATIVVRIEAPSERTRRTAGLAAHYHCGPQRGLRELCIVDHEGLRESDVIATLLHELVHLSGRWKHDRAFKAKLWRAARRAYPDADWPETPPRRMVDLDLLIAERIHACLRRRAWQQHIETVTRWKNAVMRYCAHLFVTVKEAAS